MGLYRLFAHSRYFPAVLFHYFFRGKKKEEQTAGMLKERANSEWIAFFGTPEITTAGKDSRFTGGIFQDFCKSRNVILQTAIPGRHQSLGAIARRHRLFRTIIDHVVGKTKPKNSRNKEWKEFESMTTML